jgi:glycosyltransferase involved in cell wall biosynthesis
LDVVALTSLNEGTPLSLIEAMACGRPVIATDVGGVRDLFIQGQAPVTAGTGRFRLYENGILCKSSDAQGFADALSLMAGDADLRRRMGLAGRSLVKERFSKERLIEDIEVLYNNVLN